MGDGSESEFGIRLQPFSIGDKCATLLNPMHGSLVMGGVHLFKGRPGGFIFGTRRRCCGGGPVAAAARQNVGSLNDRWV